MSNESCIIFQNPTKTITLIDIPRSIEKAQGSQCPGQLISSKPLEEPYPSVEPKSERARQNLGERSVEELLLQRFLEFALEEVRAGYVGDWCLDRATFSDVVAGDESKKKRKREVDDISLDEVAEENSTPKSHRINDLVSPNSSPRSGSSPDTGGIKKLKVQLENLNLDADSTARPSPTKTQTLIPVEGIAGDVLLYRNYQSSMTTATIGSRPLFYIPPRSTILQGDIASTRNILLHSSIQFNLIILDPPWPNRSARRKKSYAISYDSVDIASLLESIPIESKLSDDGLIGIWVTNNASFREMLLRDGGLFDRWNVKLVAEWVWLKVTRKGEPICALDSVWRKPYEVLLVGKRGLEGTPDVKRRVIVGVPDEHSRKPNLKSMFEDMMQKTDCEYQALEVFARNMTTGWWSWGDEVVRFQSKHHWVTKP